MSLTDLMCYISKIANLSISRDMDRRAQVEERRKELERTEQERKEAILAKNKVSWILALGSDVRIDKVIDRVVSRLILDGIKKICTNTSATSVFWITEANQMYGNG